MKLFMDCEFNGFQGSLLSLAFVTGDGLEWYREIPLSYREPWDGWVKDNVLPLMDDICEPVTENHRRKIIQHAQQDLETWLSQFDTIHVIADWPDDIRYFCDFLITGAGKRIHTPPLTMEIRRDIDSEQSTKPHHALFDAHAIRDAYCELLAKEGEKGYQEGVEAARKGLGITDNPYVTHHIDYQLADSWQKGFEDFINQEVFV